MHNAAIFLLILHIYALNAIVIYQYTLNLLFRADSNLTIESKPYCRLIIHWKLVKNIHNNNQRQQLITISLFNISNPTIRENQLVKNEFMCRPSDRECNYLDIKRFSSYYLGTFTYQSYLKNFDLLVINYNISLFYSIHVNCTPNFVYNKDTKTLTLVSNELNVIEIGAVVAQNSDFLPAFLNILLQPGLSCVNTSPTFREPLSNHEARSGNTES
jgi:hypothetical protein